MSSSGKLLFLVTQNFLFENLKTFFTGCNSTETLFSDADHPLSIDFKYYYYLFTYS